MLSLLLLSALSPWSQLGGTQGARAPVAHGTGKKRGSLREHQMAAADGKGSAKKTRGKKTAGHHKGFKLLRIFRNESAPLSLGAQYAAPAACKIPASPPPMDDSPCKRVVVPQHTERWAGIPSVLALLATAGELHGFSVAKPYVAGGSMIKPSYRRAIPISAYFSISPKFLRCGVDSNRLVPLALTRQPWQERVTGLKRIADDARATEAVLKAEVAIARAGGEAATARLSSAMSALSSSTSTRMKAEAAAKAAAAIVPTKRQWRPDVDELPTPFWCHGSELCVLDWTPCHRGSESNCPSWTLTPSGLMGRIISRSFDFLEENCKSAGFSLAMPLTGTWYKRHGKPAQIKRANQDPPIAGFAPGMVQVASRLADLHMRCPPNKEVSAMLRICQEPFYRKPPSVLTNRCELMLSQLNRMSAALQPIQQQTCRHFLATDCFVNADNAIPKAHNLGVQRCFQNMYGNVANASQWFSIDRTSISRALQGMGAYKDVFGRDPAGAYAMLEVAMLSRSETCIEKSHLASSIANAVRSSIGKPRCLELGKTLSLPPAELREAAPSATSLSEGRPGGKTLVGLIPWG